MAADLISADRNLLIYLAEYGGSLPFGAIPGRIFAGMIPTKMPSLIDLGLIYDAGGMAILTDKGWIAIGRIPPTVQRQS